jgi:hypothetical protein
MNDTMYYYTATFSVSKRELERAGLSIDDLDCGDFSEVFGGGNCVAGTTGFAKLSVVEEWWEAEAA